MKNIKIYALLLLAFLGACEADDQESILDVNNLENTIAQLNGGSLLTFNPAEETTNFVTVGVSTVSDQARSFTIAIDEDNTTLDASFYNIPSLTGTIAAGSFTGDIEIITPVPVTLPESDLILSIELVSVEGATILESSLSEEDIPLTVACPSVDIENVIGNGVTVSNPVSVALGGPAPGNDPRTVIAGPGENQITIVGGLVPTFGATDIVLDIDPETGEVSDAAPGGNSFDFNGGGTLTTGITGVVLTCINRISIVVSNTRFVAPFNNNELIIDIQ